MFGEVDLTDGTRMTFRLADVIAWKANEGFNHPATQFILSSGHSFVATESYDNFSQTMQMPPNFVGISDQNASEQTTCQQELIQQGKSYPRTCQECGLGPCKKHQMCRHDWLKIIDRPGVYRCTKCNREEQR